MMRRLLLTAVVALVPASGIADPVGRALEAHVLPGFAQFADFSAELSEVSQTHCTAQDAELLEAFNTAWDAWISVSHLRFGPTETANRAFGLGFWPDTRGAAPKTLRSLIAAQDPAVSDAAAFEQVSIAARGFTALEFLLYDPAFAGTGAYGCQLVQAISRDIAGIAAQINGDWQADYAGTFAADPAALETLYGAVVTGLQFTIEARFGRPLGTLERPRPTRAEARRAGRSLHHIALSLAATHDLSHQLAADHPAVLADLDTAFERVEAGVAKLDDPVLTGVADPMGRFRVEALQESGTGALTAVRNGLGPALGVAEGFNALDGD